VLVPAEIRASIGAADRPEFIRIEAAGNDGDLARIGVVERFHVVLVLWTFGDDAVGFGNEPRFDFETLIRKSIRVALMLTAQESKRVECDDERNVELMADVERCQA